MAKAADEWNQNFTKNLNVMLQKNITHVRNTSSGVSEGFVAVGRVPYPDYSLLDITQQFELYSDLILVPVGIILNVWSFWTFYKMRTYQSAPGLHLMFIAIADTVTMIGLFFYRSHSWRKYINIPFFMNSHIILCKGIPLIASFGTLWSGLLLLSATVERFVSIAFALKVKAWNLLRISKILIIVHLAISLVLSVAWVYFLELIEMYGTTFCNVETKYQDIYHKIDTFTFAVFGNGVCGGLVLIFTILIAIFLLKSKQQRSSMSHSSKKPDKEFRITFMLFLVACLFIFTKLPEIVVVQIIIQYAENKPRDQRYANALITWPVTNVLLILNHSVNFIIYVIFFKTFRDTCFICKYKANIKTGGGIKTMSSAKKGNGHISWSAGRNFRTKS